MNVIVILNENAGTAANGENVATSALQDAFATAGMTAEIRVVSCADVRETIERAVLAKPDALFVGGGDGSVSCTARKLADTGIPLGVLPLGTLNHFAKDLGLPLDWRATIAALGAGHTRDVDLGEINGLTFINNCSVGAYAEAVRKREALRREHNHGKWFAMTLATLKVIRRLRRIRFRLRLEDRDVALRSPFLLASNNRYSGKILATSLRDRLDEGVIWIYATRAHRYRTLLRMLWQAVTRDLDSANELEMYATREATVHLKKAVVPIAVDGELMEMKTPLHLRSRPGALRVLIPAPPPPPSPPSP